MVKTLWNSDSRHCFGSSTESREHDMSPSTHAKAAEEISGTAHCTPSAACVNWIVLPRGITTLWSFQRGSGRTCCREKEGPSFSWSGTSWGQRINSYFWDRGLMSSRLATSLLLHRFWMLRVQRKTANVGGSLGLKDPKNTWPRARVDRFSACVALKHSGGGGGAEALRGSRVRP